MPRHRAIAEDGPLAGDPSLTVDQSEGGDWPAEVEWRGEGRKRHLYRFSAVAAGDGDETRLAYRFVRTLEPHESDAAETR